MPLILALSKCYSAKDGIGEMRSNPNRCRFCQFLKHVLACSLRKAWVMIEGGRPIGMLNLHIIMKDVSQQNGSLLPHGDQEYAEANPRPGGHRNGQYGQNKLPPLI